MSTTLEHNISKNRFEEYEIPIEEVEAFTYDEIQREDFLGSICVYINLRKVSENELNHWKKELIKEGLNIINKEMFKLELVKSASLRNYSNILKEIKCQDLK